MSKNDLNKITPAYFSKICGSTGLFIFLVKDAFEYTGLISQDKKTPFGRVYENLNYFVKNDKEKVERLTKLHEGPFKY